MPLRLRRQHRTRMQRKRYDALPRRHQRIRINTLDQPTRRQLRHFVRCGRERGTRGTRRNARNQHEAQRVVRALFQQRQTAPRNAPAADKVRVEHASEVGVFGDGAREAVRRVAGRGGGGGVGGDDAGVGDADVEPGRT